MKKYLWNFFSLVNIAAIVVPDLRSIIVECVNIWLAPMIIRIIVKSAESAGMF